MSIIEQKKRMERKHLPIISREFEEVVLNTTARMKCGTGYTEAFIVAFLDEIKKVSIARGRMTIPNFIEIRIELKPAKSNNIKARKGMTDEQKAAVPIVPKHYVAKTKPHRTFKEKAAQKRI
jgi:hypothetical protein